MGEKSNNVPLVHVVQSQTQSRPLLTVKEEGAYCMCKIEQEAIGAIITEAACFLPYF